MRYLKHAKRRRGRRLTADQKYALKHFFHTLGTVNFELGERAETLVSQALENKKRENIWLVGYERSQKYAEKDAKGVDGMVKTDVGDIPLQVKSSEFSARIFNQNHNGRIPVVVVDVRDSLDVIFRKVVMAISYDYRKLQERRMRI